MEEVLSEGWGLSLGSLGVPIWDEIYTSKSAYLDIWEPPSFN